MIRLYYFIFTYSPMLCSRSQPRLEIRSLFNKREEDMQSILLSAVSGTFPLSTFTTPSSELTHLVKESRLEFPLQHNSATTCPFTGDHCKVKSCTPSPPNRQQVRCVRSVLPFPVNRSVCLHQIFFLKISHHFQHQWSWTVVITVGNFREKCLVSVKNSC